LRRFVLVLFSLIALFAPIRAGARGELRLSSVSVDIWPEYDQPAVLVVYHVAMAPEVILPATLTLNVPAEAQVSAVKVVDPRGGLLNVPYKRAVDGEWATLTISAVSPQVQVEYYTALTKSGTARRIVFKWVSDYSLEKLEVNFLRPLGATDVIISPMPAKIAPGQNGLMNYTDSVAYLAANQPYTVTIDYQRRRDDVSIANFSVQAVATPGADTPGRVSAGGILLWVLAGVGALLIVAGVVGFTVWQRGGRKSDARAQMPSHGEESEAGAVHCQQCGRRAQSGDVFCRACGARLPNDVSRPAA
jgi:hypothetical protein